MSKQYTISNTLIFLSIISTILAIILPEYSIYYKWGINSYFLDNGNYSHFFIQFFTGTFLHGGILHLLMNSVFVFYFGNMVEQLLGKNKYIIFFIFIVILNGLLLSQFAPYQNTVGISGFALALITYYTLELWSRKNPEYKGGITAIIVNVGIGFYPGISLYGHIFGVIGGILFYFIIKNFFSKQEIGFINNYKKFIKKVPKVMPENLKKD